MANADKPVTRVLIDVLKFLIALIAAFLVIMSLYEFLIRRHNVLRFLFEMRPRSKRGGDLRGRPQLGGVK